jgi:hypothetical protein
MLRVLMTLIHKVLNYDLHPLQAFLKSVRFYIKKKLKRSRLKRHQFKDPKMISLQRKSGFSQATMGIYTYIRT